MNYFEAVGELNKGIAKPIYLISGEETFLASKLEKKIIAKLLPESEQDGLNVMSGDVEIEALIQLIDTVPFFGEKNMIVIRNTNLFKERKKNADHENSSSKAEDKLIELFADMPPYSALLLITPEKADKRRKLYKTIAKYGAVVEVLPIKAWEVKDWLQEKLHEIDRQFARDAYEYFLELTSVMNHISLGFLDQELDKVALASDKKMISKQELVALLASIPEVSIFAMLDAISDKKVKKALQLLSEQFTAGEHPLKIITMLSRHARQLWQAKLLARQGQPSKTIAGKLGLLPIIAERLVNKSKNFQEEVLKNALLQLADADYKLKSGQSNCILLENIIIELCA
jgi:DNA polymerase-3 subunit delta